MSRGDVDDVVTFLTSKFNKIYYEREFVCSVLEDFQKVLKDPLKCCVLVFPTLGPIYLKALRYQARYFELVVFNIVSASGRFKSIAVCHKAQLAKSVRKEMSAEVSKRKRPERQLYVPPAQRAVRGPPKHAKNITCTSDKSDTILGLSDIVNLSYVSKSNPFPLRFTGADNHLRPYYFIQIYHHFQYLFIDFDLDGVSHQDKPRNFISEPFVDLSLKDELHLKHASILGNELSDFDHDVPHLETGIFLVECSIKEEAKNESVLDLSVIETGHFCILDVDGEEYLIESQEEHNPDICRKNVIKKVVKTVEDSKLNENERNSPNKNSKTLVRNKINNVKKSDSDKIHEEEKEIMRLTKEYMNRKTKPIMKYVHENHTLTIDENVNNWEDLFDENGQIPDGIFSEVADKVGNDITIVKATEDYSIYTNKPPEELEHVVELYNFPSTLETHDLVHAFSDIHSDCMYIKWVDDTHALLVLGSLTQARKAMNVKNPLIKVRPMTVASAISIDVANKSDLRPAMKRPPTNLQTARRLITSHLGTKSKVTKEQMAKEKQDLKDAKEMKRLIKQNEKDAWEGTIRSSLK